jgi:hypothetical protein
MPKTSPAAKQIAAKLAPKIQSVAREYEDTFVGHAGGPVTRLAARTMYPVLVREVPTGVEVGAHELLNYLSGLSLPQLIAHFSDHATFTGHALHPSLAAFRLT